MARESNSTRKARSTDTILGMRHVSFRSTELMCKYSKDKDYTASTVASEYLRHH